MAWTSIWLQSLINKNIQREEKKENLYNHYKEIEYSHLAPNDNAENQTFFSALDYALNEGSHIHNIAITGNYGSGKSSLINSYFSKQDTKNVINISLATFEIEDKQTNTRKLPDETLQKIEKSILQQIFYRDTCKKFPQSRFSRIRKTNFWENICFSTILIIIISFLIKLLKKEIWDSFIEMLKFNKEKIPSFLFTWLFIITLFIIFSFILRLLNRISLKKFSFQKVEFGIDEVNKESLLNKYIDEILYFFETTNYDTVVFENLDRFNTSEIYIKLRELNTVLNNYEPIKKRKHNVVFIYALKDDVFVDNTRTKFFEFIIPVIPVINSNNSLDILLNRRNNTENSPLHEIDEHFIQDIGLYIDDMRLLLNCINEFKIYDEQINKSNYLNEMEIAHDRNKIFALVLYKNLYPKDFASLSLNEGFLYSVFKHKESYISKEKKRLENEIKKI